MGDNTDGLLTQDTELEENSLYGENGNNTRDGRQADDQGVRFEDELRLMLLRHWSLEEGLRFSSYVASKLGVWKERGRARVTNLLAKMGYKINSFC